MITVSVERGIFVNSMLGADRSTRMVILQLLKDPYVPLLPALRMTERLHSLTGALPVSIHWIESIYEIRY